MHRRQALAALLAGPLMAARALHAQTTDLTSLTIAAAASQLASGSITPLQLTNAYLSRIATMNKELNAYVTVTADLARREAKGLAASRGQLWGIPIAHKDLFETKGIRTTAGSLLYEEYVPDTNAAIVQQLEQAGAVNAAIADVRSKVMAIEDVSFPVTSKTMAQVFDPVVSFEIWGRFAADWRTNPGSFSKDFAAFFATPRPSIAHYESGLAALKEYQAAVERLFDSVDVIITPTVPVTAPLIESRIDGMKILRNTWPFNAAGTPAISIPLKTTGLPVGLQLIAKRGNDDKLLQIARYILP